MIFILYQLYGTVGYSDYYLQFLRKERRTLRQKKQMHTDFNVHVSNLSPYSILEFGRLTLRRFRPQLDRVLMGSSRTERDSSSSLTTWTAAHLGP